MALDPVLSISNPASPIAVSAQQWRRLDVASTMAHDAHDVAARAGVASGMACTVSGLTVTMAPGSAIVTPSAGTNGSYRVAAGSNTSVALPARSASFSRNDLVVLRVYDAGVDVSGRWEATLEVVAGTPSASPVDPSAPTGALVLYRAIVPPSGTVTMVDLRVWSAALGGVLPCLSSSRPSGAGLRVGQHVYETNTGIVRVWTGTEWRNTLPRIPAIAAGQTNTSGAITAVTFPSGRFANPPIVTATLASGAGAFTWNAVRVLNVTAAGFSIYVNLSSDNSGAPIMWTAVEAG